MLPRKGRHPTRVTHPFRDIEPDPEPRYIPSDLNWPKPAGKKYNYLRASDEVEEAPSEETRRAHRIQLAEALLAVSRAVQTFVSQYIIDENLDGYAVKLQARVYADGAWGQWTGAGDVDFGRLGSTPSSKFDADYMQTVPSLKYRTVLTHGDTTLLYITAQISPEETNNHVVVRQIAIESSVSEDEITIQLFGWENARSFAELRAQPPQITRTETLLRMCDIAIVKEMFKDATQDGSTVFVRFDVENGLRWAVQKMFNGSYENRTVFGRLRARRSDGFFLDATEMLDRSKVKKNRTFSTVAEFIAWASGSRIKNKAKTTIQLTRDDPHLLMLSTLARVLDVLDGRIALIAQN
jgi:hypothetical protein